MERKDNCGVCGTPLVYSTEAISAKCSLCGETRPTLIYCPQAHYICDSCHGLEAIDTLRQVLDSTTSTSPLEIFEQVISHPSVPMHGPEHHSMVPAIIVAAARNAGYPIPDGAIEQAITRGAKVPGGWCGSHGACGAALGVGTAISVLTGATPLTGETRALANAGTAFTLERLLDGHPRCCKRASRNALTTAVTFLKERMGITLDNIEPIKCAYYHRNKECVKDDCPYYPPGAP